MTNPTDTNQASEDELMRELRLLYGRRVSSNLSLAEYFLEMRQLIRTEKLKLLDRLEKQATIVTSLSGEKAGTIHLTAIENERNKDV